VKKEAPHYYGGQAVLEGVMMRGRDSWAIACRRPNDDIYLETHEVKGFSKKNSIWRKPLFRGVATMAEALSIGMRAMMIAANQSLEEEQKLTKKQMGGTIAFAVVAFVAIFILLPSGLSNIFGGGKTKHVNSLVQSAKEGGIRLAIFLGYLIAISFVKEIRRVFQYHGAEHKTIAAYEAKEPVLEPAAVDKYSTIHVRCGTNFLIITMLLTILVFALFGQHAWWVEMLMRIPGVFLLAGIAYEGLRLGAAHTESAFVRALMKPGLWLQKITTRQPEPGMIEVAIRSFQAVLPEEERAKVASLPSPVVYGNSLVDEDPAGAERAHEAIPGAHPDDAPRDEPEP
jgi:uncharacterized protein YqhQ